MNWCKSLTAALIAVVSLTPMPSRAQSSPMPSRPQSSPNLPSGVYSSPGNSLVPNGQQQQNYLGQTYQILPFGLQDLGGWLVGEPVGSRLYNVASLQTGALITDAPQAQKQMLWFETVVFPADPDPEGRVSYKVLDVLNLPPLKTSDVLVGSPGLQCTRNGVRDPEIVAIATYSDTNYLEKIKQAWRANRKTGKFESIPARNIVCDNTSRGYR